MTIYPHSPMESQDIFTIIRYGASKKALSSLEDVDINQRDDNGETLLHAAIACRKDDEIALHLLEKGINVNAQEVKGQTALHYCAVWKKNRIAEELLNIGGDLNIRDIHGNNAMWTVVFNCRGEYELVKICMRLKPDVTTPNKHGRSPLDFARQIKDDVLIELLTA